MLLQKFFKNYNRINQLSNSKHCNLQCFLYSIDLYALKKLNIKLDTFYYFIYYKKHKDSTKSRVSKNKKIPLKQEEKVYTRF